MSGTAPPRIAVVGPGAIGTTVAALLHEAGRTPLVAGRSPQDGLRLETDTGTIVVPGPVRTDPREGVEPVDLLFLAVKTTHTAAAAPWLEALCSTATTVCVLQNGIEQVDAVSPIAGGAEVVPAVVWFPARREASRTVRLLGEPRLSVPEGDGGLAVRRALLDTRCTVDVSPDFHTLAWRKLLQNAVAGLMVLTGRRSGMFRRDDVAPVALAYLRECLEVARADGADLDDDEPARILARFREAPVDLGTSILADREAGQTLEWDVRNGVVRRRGLRLGVPTPVSDLLVPLLAAASDGPG